MDNTNLLHNGVARVLIDKVKAETTEETPIFIEGIDFEEQIFQEVKGIYYKFLDSAFTRIGNKQFKGETIFFLHHRYWFIAVITNKSNIEEQMVRLYHLLPIMEKELDHSRNNLKQAKFVADQFIAE